MARRKYTQPGPAVEPLTDVPGPEADVSALREHYRRVQTARATHRYDDIVTVCYWCLADDQQVPANGKRSPLKFCCQRCADAHEAFMVAVYGPSKPKEDNLDDIVRRREAAQQEEQVAADGGAEEES